MHIGPSLVWYKYLQRLQKTNNYFLLTLEFTVISAITGLILIFSQTGKILRQDPILLCSNREQADVSVRRHIWLTLALSKHSDENFILFTFETISITSTVGSITIDVTERSEKIFQQESCLTVEQVPTMFMANIFANSPDIGMIGLMKLLVSNLTF